MVNLVSVAVRALLFGGEGRKLNTKAVNSPCSTVVEYQPVAVVCAGDTATVTTYTQTRTECANGCITPEQCSQPPVVTVTTTVPGTTPGTSTVTPPADCDRPCTTSIIVTTTPEPSATTTQPPDVTVTTTVPGTTPGTIIVTTTPEPSATTTQPPDVTVTTTVPGTTPGTSTVTPPADCDRPCTTSIIVTTTPEPSSTTTVPSTTTSTTCTLQPRTSIISAAGSSGRQTNWVIPPCATAIAFTVVGGAGGGASAAGASLAQGGAGGLVSGKIRVIPGQPVIAFAGGAGAAGRGGESQYGSGGSAPAVAGGGGGASALMINTVSNLVAVAGGGGGLQASSQYSLNAGGNIATASFDGPPNADHDGRGVGLLVNGNYVARAFGGKRGTTSGSGAGGTWSSTTSTISRANGNPGIGTQGGAGVPGANNHGLQAGTGGGGGGFYGGGSGGRVYYQQPNVRTGSRWFDHAGSGGGGGSFTNIYTFETSKGVSAPSVGSIRVVFY
ncbi:hypothetical protein MY8738_009049 [Beauveria namnaoensis]